MAGQTLADSQLISKHEARSKNPFESNYLRSRKALALPAYHFVHRIFLLLGLFEAGR